MSDQVTQDAVPERATVPQAIGEAHEDAAAVAHQSEEALAAFHRGTEPAPLNPEAE